MEDHAPMYEPRIPTMCETAFGGLCLFQGTSAVNGQIWSEKNGRTSYIWLVRPFFIYCTLLCGKGSPVRFRYRRAAVMRVAVQDAIVPHGMRRRTVENASQKTYKGTEGLCEWTRSSLHFYK